MEFTAGTTTRRRVLLGIGATGMVALAGCTGSTSDGAENVPVLGNENADVTLEVYEDMGCPACGEYVQNSFDNIRSQYVDTNQIRYEHRDLMSTSQGPLAANAAREVFERHGNDAFWEFKSEIFADQGGFRNSPTSTIEAISDDLGFETQAILDAVDDQTHSDAIDADESRASSLGANTTPSFVVNESLAGRGAGSVPEVVQELDAELQ